MHITQNPHSRWSTFWWSWLQLSIGKGYDIFQGRLEELNFHKKTKELPTWPPDKTSPDLATGQSAVLVLAMLLGDSFTREYYVTQVTKLRLHWDNLSQLLVLFPNNGYYIGTFVRCGCSGNDCLARTLNRELHLPEARSSADDKTPEYDAHAPSPNSHLSQPFSYYGPGLPQS